MENNDLRSSMRPAFEYYKSRLNSLFNSVPEIHLIGLLEKLQEFTEYSERKTYFDYKKFRLLRKERGISQVQIAKRAGCSRQYVSSIEKGQSFASEEIANIYYELEHGK